MQLSTDPAAVSEGEDISLAVTSNKALTGTQQVNLTLAARDSSGFTAADIQGTLGPRNFDADFGSTPSRTGTVTIPTSSDSSTEGAEAYRITLNAGTGYTVGSDSTADGTVDDPPVLQLLADPETVSEGNDISLTVTSNRVLTGTQQVNLTLAARDSSGFTADDIVGTLGPRNFDAVFGSSPNTTGTVTIPTSTDTSVEGDEAYRITLNAGTGYTVGSDSTADGTLSDPPPSLQLSTDPATVTEGNDISLTVTSNKALTGTQQVNLTLAARDSSGFTADDIEGTLGPRNFDAVFGSSPNTTGTVTIPTSTDTSVEGDEAYRITLNTGTGYTVGSDSTADGTLDELPPSLQLSTDPETVTEGNDISLTVTSSRALTGTVAVNLTLAARDSSGFTADDIVGTLGPRNFDADFGATPSRTGTVTIPTSTDTSVEGDEAYRITLNAGTRYTVGGDSIADGTLIDPTVLQLSTDPATVTEGNDISLTVTSNKALTGTQQVNLTLAARDSSGFTADDIVGTLGPRNFDAVFGSSPNTTGTVTIPTLSDSSVEGGEAYRVTLNAGTGYKVGGDSTADGTLDDPAEQLSGFAVESAKGLMELSWTDPNDDSITGYEYRYKTDHQTATDVPYTSWLEVPGSDADTTSYTLTTGLTNFSVYTFQVRTDNGLVSPEEASMFYPKFPEFKPVTVSPASVESAGDYEFTLSGSGWVPQVSPTSLGVFFIACDYPPDGDINKIEGNPNICVKNIAFAGGLDALLASIRGARVNSDGSWTGKRTFTVPDEGMAILVAVIDALGGDLSLDEVGAVVIPVVSPKSVSVPAVVAVTEGTDANATVRVGVGEAFGESVTFNVSYGGTASGASDPADGDYDNDAVTSVTFGAEDTSKDIAIPITDDDLDEPDETITVTIASAADLPEGFSLGNATATVTIADDDNSPVLEDLTDVTVKVGEQVSVRATATDADSDTISYAWTRKAGETTPALPETTLNTRRLRFTPTEAGTYTMTVTASDGNGNSDTETVVITVAAKTVVSVPAAVAVTEGTDSSATVTISVAEAFGESVTFNVSYGGTATGASDPANGDYDNDAVTSITFGNRATSKNIVIPITDDDLDEGDETITVTIAPSAVLPAGFVLGNATATVTIADDDSSPVLEELTDVTVKIGQQVSITANAIDADSDTISYAWTRKSGETTPALPATTLNRKRLRFTPTTTGTYTMTVTASDGNGNSDAETVVITVGAKTVVSVPAAVAVTEGTDSDATVTISVAEAFGESVTFNVSYGGTATGANNPANGDYDNDAVTSITFGTRATSKNIVIPITDDDLDETDETITVTVAPSATLPAGFVLGNAVATVTITDDDSSPVLDALADVDAKVGQQVDITANATDADSDTISYAWARKAGETTPALPQGMVFNTKRLTFTPTRAGVYTMVVTASDGNGNSDTETVVITVTAKTVVSVPAAVAVTEGTDTNATVTISVTEAFGQSVTFNVSYSGTATGAANPANGDYDNDAVTSVTFGTGDTSKDIVIPITDDDLDEAAETITVTVASSAALPTGFTLGNATATVTITDDDNSPVLADLEDVTVKIGQRVNIRATATDADSDTISYAWTRKAGETTPALPETSLGARRLRFTPTQAGVYTMIVTASDGNGNSDTETVTITVNAKTVVSVPEAVAVTEGTNANATVTVSVAEAFGQSVTFNVSYGGTATGANNPANGDYDNDAVTSVTFGTADTSKNIAIPITDDDLDEAAETIVVTVASSAALPAGFVLGNATATVTITDDDNSPVLDDLTAVRVKAGQQVNITANATDADSDTISYAWTRKAGETTPALPQGTALNTKRLRFTPTATGTYTMTVTASDGNGNTDTKTVVITVLADTPVSVPETVAVTEGTDSNATVMISVAEAFGQSVTFNISYSGTATGANNPANGDYDNDAAKSVTFGTTDTSKNIVIPITDDDLDETAETIVVTIAPSAALPAGFTLGNTASTVTITDDDNSPVLAELTDVGVKVGQQVDITANATDTDVGDTISYTWTRKSGETTPALPVGTALNTKRLTFTPTATGTYTMTVTANDGNGNTDTETVVITVAAKVVVSVPATVAVTEGTDSNATVTISLAESFGQSVTFNVTYGGTATGAANPADGDYDNDAVTSVTFGTSDTSKNIVVPITDDGLDETAETIVVTVAPSAALPAGFTLGNAVATVTITDDDDSPVLGDLADVGVKVGQQVDITANATDTDTGDTISYAWTRKSGETTPALPVGTALNAKRLTFTPTATGTYTMTVTANDGNGNTDTETVVITVTAKVVVSVPATVAVTEGTDSNATVTISLAEGFGQSVTFNVSYGGTATGASDPADGDYDNDAVTSVTFSTSDTSKNIVIPITDDGLDETAETITVTVAPSAALPAGFTLGNAATTVTVTDDDNSPVLGDLAAVGVKVGQQVDITANATDTDVGDTISYTWTRKSGETTPVLPEATTLNTKRLTFTPTATGTYTMTVTANDGNGNTDTETVVITVAAKVVVSVPATVAVTEGTDSNATVTISLAEAFGQSVTFNITYSGTATGAANPSNGDYDNDAVTSVTFNTTDTSKNIVIPITDDGLDESAETITVTITPSAALPAGYTLGNAATTVTVTDDDDSPVLGDLAAVGVKVGQLVDITANATDADGDTISYTWTRKSGETTPALPGGTALAAKRLMFTPTATGTYTMTVTANDGNGNTDTETVVITVAAKVVVSVPATVAVTEGTNSNATVTISLAEAFSQSVTFNVTYSGTATGAANPSNGDYDNDAVTSVTFSTSDTSKNIVIPITNDGLDENAETIIVTIAPSAALPAGYTLGNATITVTITDDDNSPVLEDLADVTLKAGQLVDITANATDADSDTVSYAWARKAGETTPALPPSTALNTKQLTFTPTTTGTYTMTVTANDGNENTDTKTVTITVNPKVVVSVPATVAVTEGTDSNATVTISLAEAFGQSVTFNIDYGGTATGAADPSDGDYDNDAVTSVTFNTTDTSKNIVVPITDDDLDESAETITVTIEPSAALPAGYRLGNAASTVTITDDDNSPVLGDLADVTLKAGQLVDVTANATDADGDTISYAWTRKANENLPALPQSTALGAKQLTFTPTTAGVYTMTVTADDGNANSDAETVVITVNPKTVVSVPAAVVATEGNDKNATVTISLAEAFGQSVTFNVTYSGTATGAADPANGDYDNDAVTSITFGTSEVSKDIVIPITDDNVVEGAETIVVTIAPSAALPAGYRLGNATTTVTITDYDSFPLLVTAKVGQLVDVIATAASTDDDNPYTYLWARKTGETTPALPTGTLLNQARLTFTPTRMGTYTMTVTATDSNNNTVSTETVTITVVADTVISIPAMVSVTEGTDNFATVRISTAEPPTQDTTFEVISDSAPHGDPAISNMDYDEVSEVVFEAGERFVDVMVPITDDGIDEDNETFLVIIVPVNPLPGGFVMGNTIATVTIADDDSSPVLKPIESVTVRPGQKVNIAASATDEDGDTVTYEWSRKAGEVTPPLPQGTALDEARLLFTPTQVGTYTMTVTADDGNTNTDTRTVTIAVVGTLSFGPGEVSKTVTIPIPDDEVDEETETITVTIEPVSELPAGFRLGNATATITVIDDDSSPVLEPLDNVTAQVGQRIDITASATHENEDETITYAWAREPGETTPPLPEGTTLNTARLRFTTTASGTYTMTVTATDTHGNTDTQTITITVGNPPTPEEHEISPTDNHTNPLELAPLSDLVLRLGQQVDITAVATHTNEDETITYAWTRKPGETTPPLPEGTALNTARLTFTPTQTGTYTMTVMATDTNDYAYLRTITITITTDNLITIKPTTTTITEGTNPTTTITITLDKPLQQPTTLNLHYTHHQPKN
ncbi:PKD domain-containing protein [Candidatus Poriferisocius sp.]|uniref:PKD domain-containing protein n=1 Tax=Candidatus Poriferisocius sp. TaxID=3101276 RepID=UPI003B01CC68